MTDSIASAPGAEDQSDFREKFRNYCATNLSWKSLHTGTSHDWSGLGLALRSMRFDGSREQTGILLDVLEQHLTDTLTEEKFQGAWSPIQEFIVHPALGSAWYGIEDLLGRSFIVELAARTGNIERLLAIHDKTVTVNPVFQRMKKFLVAKRIWKETDFAIQLMSAALETLQADPGDVARAARHIFPSNRGLEPSRAEEIRIILHHRANDTRLLDYFMKTSLGESGSPPGQDVDRVSSRPEVLADFLLGLWGMRDDSPRQTERGSVCMEYATGISTFLKEKEGFLLNLAERDPGGLFRLMGALFQPLHSPPQQADVPSDVPCDSFARAIKDLWKAVTKSKATQSAAYASPDGWAAFFLEQTALQDAEERPKSALPVVVSQWAAKHTLLENPNMLPPLLKGLADTSASALLRRLGEPGWIRQLLDQGYCIGKVGKYPLKAVALVLDRVRGRISSSSKDDVLAGAFVQNRKGHRWLVGPRGEKTEVCAALEIILKRLPGLARNLKRRENTAATLAAMQLVGRAQTPKGPS